MMETPPRRLLLLNPNTSTATTARLTSVLQPLVPASWRLEARTAAFGARYIACEASHAVAGHAVLDSWAAHREETPGRLDAVLIGCFGDPGLFALRESSACAVTGLAEASFIQAARHGAFAIVTGGERWKPMLQRLAGSLGYGGMLRHIETVAPTGAQLMADEALALRTLGEACRAAAQPGVKSVILGGAGLAGYAELLQAQLPVPLIDSARAGLEVMLQGLAPMPVREEDGFVAEWSGTTLSLTDRLPAP
ncbi:MAG: aspartate/glutamate racemase family protein [Burkholderiaceae bacterium]